MLKRERVQTVQATEKTLELLEILSAGGEGLHIGDLADRLQISSKKVLLLLVTLESHGMARWDERGREYLPGRKTEALARRILELGEVGKAGTAVVSKKPSQSKARGKGRVAPLPILP